MWDLMIDRIKYGNFESLFLPVKTYESIEIFSAVI